MRGIAWFLLAVIVGFFLWQGTALGMAIHSCGIVPNDVIRTKTAQAQSPQWDRATYCALTYDTITTWDDCVMTAEKAVQVPYVSRVFSSVVTYVLRLLADPSASLEQVKLEHDDMCKDQINTLFYPPVAEQ